MATQSSTREKALTAITNLQIPAQGLRRSVALWGIDNPESMTAVGPLCKELLDLASSLTCLRTSLENQTDGSDPYTAVEARLPSLTAMLNGFEVTLRKLQQDVEAQEHAADGATDLIKLLEGIMELVKQMKSSSEIFTNFMAYTDSIIELSTSLSADLGVDAMKSTQTFLRELILPTRPEAPMVARKPLPRNASGVDVGVQTYGVDPSAPVEKASASPVLRAMETMSIADLGVEMKLIRRGGMPETTVPDARASESVVLEQTVVAQSVPTPTAVAENKTETTGMMIHPITGTLMPETEALEAPKATSSKVTNEGYKETLHVNKAVEQTASTITGLRAAAETHAKLGVPTQESAEAKGGVSFLTGPSWPFGSTNQDKPSAGNAKKTTQSTATDINKLPDGNPGQFLFSTNPSSTVQRSSNSGIVGKTSVKNASSRVKSTIPIVRKPVKKLDATTSALKNIPTPKRMIPKPPEDSPAGELHKLHELWQKKRYELALVQSRGPYYKSSNNYPNSTAAKLLHKERCKNYAMACDLADKHEEASGGWQDVLKFTEQSLGKYHPDTLVAIIHIGLANERMKQINTARSYYKRAMAAAQKLATKTAEDAYVSSWWQLLNLEFDPAQPTLINASVETFVKYLESKHLSVGEADSTFATSCFSNLRNTWSKTLFDQSKDNVVLEDEIFIYAVAGDVRPLVAAILDRSPYLLYTTAIRGNIAAGAGEFGYVDVLIYLYERQGFDIDMPEEDGYTALHNAVSENKYNTAKKLVELGADIEAHSTDGASPLVTAAKNGNMKIATLLLDAGASLSAVPGFDWYPLLVAIGEGKANMVDFLIERGASLDDRMTNGWDAIYLAAMEEKSSDEILLKIINYGKRQGRDLVNRAIVAPGAGQHLDSPLIGAIIAKKPTRAKILMEHGADVDHKNDCNGRPLYYAAQVHDRRLVAELLKRGADLEAKAPDGSSILHLLAEHDTGEGTKCLVEAGANINSTNNVGTSPLTRAVCAQNKPVVKYLLERGANIESVDIQNWRPLHFAAIRDGLEFVQMLLDAGAQVDAVTDKGYTPMHLSIHAKKQANFELLMTAGATVFTQNYQGLTPLMASLQSIENHGMFQTIISAALDSGDPRKAKDYINARHYEIGYISINFAAEIGNNAAIRTLCNNDVDIDSRETSRGFSPLTHAADNGHISTCEVLISLGASIFVSDPFQGGPLGRAIRQNRLDMVKLFVQKDPNLISAINTDPDTCFIEADEMDDKLEVLEYLLQQGADPNKIDHMGGTPLYWANVCRRPNHLEVSRILRAYGAVSSHGGFNAALRGFKIRFGLFERNYQWNKNRTHFKTFLKWLDVATFLVLLGYYDDAAIAAEQALEWEFEYSKDGIQRRKLFEGKTDRSFSWLCEVCEKFLGLDTSAQFLMCKSCRGFTVCKKCYEGKMPAWEKRNMHKYVSVPREMWYTLKEGIVDIDSSGRKFSQEGWLERIKEIKEPLPGYTGHMEKTGTKLPSPRQETIIRY